MKLTLDQALQKGIEAHKAGKAQEADQYYTAVIKAQPKHPDANHNMGVLAVGVGKVEEAIPFFKAALEANPSIAQFWLSYIDTLIKLDRIEEAKSVLDQAKSKGAKGDGFDKIGIRIASSNSQKSKVQEPSQDQLQSLVNLYTQGHYKETLNKSFQLLEQYSNSINLYNIIGAANTGLGKLDEAIEAYTRALVIKPDFAEAYNNMGNALKDQGKLDEAIEAYTRALVIKPDYAEAYNNMGIAVKEQGKLDEAIEAYTKALSLKADYAEAYNNMGNTFAQQGKLDEAIETYNKALSIKPIFADAYNNMGNALKDQGKLDEAIEAYTEALSIQPNHANAYYNIGVVLKDQGKLEEAIEAYTKAILIKPDYAEAYNNMGNALKDQGRLEEAIAAYTKTLSIKPEYAEACYNMGNALKDLYKLEEAIAAYTKTLSIKPDYAEAYNNMGNALKDQSKLGEAIEAYTKALSIKPHYANAYYNMGNAFKEQDKLEVAVEAYTRALSIKPDYAEAYSNMGVVLKDQGKLDQALEAYTKAIEIKPDLADVHHNLSWIKTYTDDDKHFLQVKELFKRSGLGEVEKCHFSFALAKMYEDIGTLDQSFAHLSNGNALRKKLLNYSIKQDHELFIKLKNTQPHLLKNSLEIIEKSIEATPIFILGMPRSGTSLVEQIISSHAEVTGAGELNYLALYGGNISTNFKSEETASLSMFRGKYLSELSKISNGKEFITDKMPQNFRFVPLICAALPEAKIIHVQRNASAICWSNYKQYFVSNSLGYCYDLKDVVEYYKLYKELMDLWQSQYGDRIYNLNYEKLTTDQENQTRKLINYLGLNWEEACLSPQKNKRNVRTASQQQVRKQVYQGSSEAWRKYEPYLNGAFNTLPS